MPLQHGSVSTSSPGSVPTLTSSAPPSYSLYPFHSLLLPQCYWLHSSILVSLTLLSLLASLSLAPSSLPLIQSRSSASQIDFAAVLRSPISSQIGFPTYPLPVALRILFLHCSHVTFFFPTPVLTFGLLSLMCWSVCTQHSENKCSTLILIIKCQTTQRGWGENAERLRKGAYAKTRTSSNPYCREWNC